MTISPIICGQAGKQAKMSTDAVSSRDNITGMLLCGLSSFFFALTGTLVKLTDFPKEMIVEIRSILQVFFCFAIILFTKRDGNFDILILGHPKHRKYLVWRSLLYWAAIMCYWQALGYLDIGDATAFVYSSPIFSGILAFTWLKEPWRWSYLVFTSFNVCGLILISRPSFLFGNSSEETSSTGIILALIGAVFVGSLGPLVRKSKGAHWVTVELYAHTSSAFLLTPALLFLKKMYFGVILPSGVSFPWIKLVLISVSGFSGLACHTIAYQYAQASTGSLLMYIEIPLAYGLQIAVFGKAVDIIDILGCICIVGSGIASLLWQLYVKTETSSEQELAPLLDVGESKSKYGAGSLTLTQFVSISASPHMFGESVSL